MGFNALRSQVATRMPHIDNRDKQRRFVPVEPIKKAAKHPNLTSRVKQAKSSVSPRDQLEKIIGSTTLCLLLPLFASTAAAQVEHSFSDENNTASAANGAFYGFNSHKTLCQ